MNNKLLIAYATIHGATAEIADRLAETLDELGLQADVRPAAQVKTLDGYNAVVLGAPLYMFHWHKDALRFLARFKREIGAGIPVAVFAGGPWDTKPETWEGVRANLDKQLAKAPWFKPRSVLVVGGRFDPNSLRFPYNLIPAMKQQPAVDLRNWDEISAWAGTLADTLKS